MSWFQGAVIVGAIAVVWGLASLPQGRAAHVLAIAAVTLGGLLLIEGFRAGARQYGLGVAGITLWFFCALPLTVLLEVDWLPGLPLPVNAVIAATAVGLPIYVGGKLLAALRPYIAPTVWTPPDPRVTNPPPNAPQHLGMVIQVTAIALVLFSAFVEIQLVL